jgi:hypothetical protein
MPDVSGPLSHEPMSLRSTTYQDYLLQEDHR